MNGAMILMALMLVMYPMLSHQHIPKGCTLTSHEASTTLNCTDAGLKDIPSALPHNLTGLIVSGNYIHTVRNLSLITSPQLRMLSLPLNNIHTLQSAAFFGLTHLLHLDLSQNNLTYTYDSIPKDVFSHMLHLQELRLLCNNASGISTYPDQVFKNLRSLEVLSMDSLVNTTFGTSFKHLKNLEQLDMAGCGCAITSLSKDTFENLEFTHLSTLNLSQCIDISSVHPLTFKYLPHLKIFSLTYLEGNVPLKEVTTALKVFKGKTMELIDLYGMYRPSSFTSNLTNRLLTKDVIEPLTEICLRKFNFGYNNQLYVDMSAFLGQPILKCVEEIIASENHFLGGNVLYMILSAFTKLRILDISVSSVPRWNPFTPWLDTTHTPALGPSGDLSGELIRKWPINNATIDIYVPATLEKVNLRASSDFVNLLSTTSIVVKNGFNLKTFDCSFVGLRSISHFIYGLENLLQLDASGNDLSTIVPTFFDTVPSLEILVLHYVNIGDYSNFERLFGNLHQLQELTLSRNRLKDFPTRMFSDRNHMRRLDFSDNKFEFIPLNFDDLSFLTYLDMSENLLTTIPRTQRDALDKISYDHTVAINLAGNSLSCGCQTLDFIEWLATTRVTFSNEELYTCVDEHGVLTNTSDIQKHHIKVWRMCVGKISLFISAILFMVLSITLIITWILVKHWGVIKHHLLHYIAGCDWPQRKDFKYDVYVGYSEEDYSFACLHLGRHLEQNNRLRVFLRDRDSNPGTVFADEIVRGVNNSWVTLILLTPHCIEDEWMTFIAERAVYETRFMPRRLVVLLVGDADMGDLPPSVEDTVRESNIFVCEDYMDVMKALTDIAALVTSDGN